jgi:hypothetical protein
LTRATFTSSEHAPGTMRDRMQRAAWQSIRRIAG